MVKKGDVLKNPIGFIKKAFRVVRARISIRVVRFLLNRNNGECSERLSNYLKKAESETYQRQLKSWYIKKILPRTYKKNASKPVENKVLFMVLSSAAEHNANFAYLLNKLKSEHDYEIGFHSLMQGSVPQSVYYHNAETFMKDLPSAKALFMRGSANVLGYVDIRKETKVIQLWHGCGSFKKMGLSRSTNKETKLEYPGFNKCTTVTISSPDLSWIFEEFMGIDKETGIIAPIGVSRTDELFDEKYKDEAYRKLYERIPAAKDKKIILYAPTFRGSNPAKGTAPEALDIGMFAQELSDEYILLVKHHQTIKKLPSLPEEYSNTFAYDVSRCNLGINDLLIVSDICISDYSSLVTEFSLFERPLLFFVFDIEDYGDSRGLYYDYTELMPGPLCKTTEEMVDFIKNIDTRFNKQEVIDFKHKFVRSCDGHATERIIALIEE